VIGLLIPHTSSRGGTYRRTEGWSHWLAARHAPSHHPTSSTKTSTLGLALSGSPRRTTSST
jgi:hypothetical protein